MVTLAAAPPNDDFEHRQTLLTSRLAVGSTYAATHQAGEPDHGNGTNSASLWWTWTAPSDGLYATSTRAGGQSAHICRGDTLTNLTAVKTKPTPLGLIPSRIEFEAMAGIAYQIAVDAAAGHGSSFGLSVFPVPPNDHFVNRILLAGRWERGQPCPRVPGFRSGSGGQGCQRSCFPVS